MSININGIHFTTKITQSSNNFEQIARTKGKVLIYWNK